MPTRNVVLTQHYEDMIETLLASGRYQNASEILREGLRLVEQREAEDIAKLTALREVARVGFDAIERGDYKEFSNTGALTSYLRDLSDEALRPDER